MADARDDNTQLICSTEPNCLCEICNILRECKASHRRNAIALIWRATWNPGRRWAQ